jgi:hypothetical protein
LWFNNGGAAICYRDEPSHLGRSTRLRQSPRSIRCTGHVLTTTRDANTTSSRVLCRGRAPHIRSDDVDAWFIARVHGQLGRALSCWPHRHSSSRLTSPRPVDPGAALPTPSIATDLVGILHGANGAHILDDRYVVPAVRDESVDRLHRAKADNLDVVLDVDDGCV